MSERREGKHAAPGTGRRAPAHTATAVSRKPILILALVLIVALAAILLIVHLKKNKAPDWAVSERVGSVQELTVDEALIGVWRYDDQTQYQFGADGSACMRYEGTDYPGLYSAADGQLEMDFDNQGMHAHYTYSIDGDTLVLFGGEGTVGGTYSLKRAG